MVLATKHFSIERLKEEDFDLRVSYHCLNCGFTSICDLYKVSLETCLDQHLRSCPNKPREEVPVASEELKQVGAD
jgi:hypothetical protein